MTNTIINCKPIDNPDRDLQCLQFSYDNDNTDDVASLLKNGTQHNLIKFRFGNDSVFTIYDMFGEFTNLNDGDWIVKYSDIDFEVVTDDDFKQQFKLMS